MQRVSMRALVLVLMAALSVGVLGACGDDAADVVDSATSAADQARDTATGAADTVTSAADDAKDTATDAAGGAAGGGEATTVVIPAAEQGLAFAKTEASAPAGEVTLRMPNPSTISHSIAVDEPEDAEGKIVMQGGTSEITVNFPSGTYEYYCEVPGHREAGMVGTLTVQ